MALVLSLVSPPAAFGADQIQFRLSPAGAETSKISLTVPAGETGGSVTVFLGQSGDQPLKVRFLPRLDSGALMVLDESNQQATGITLPPLGEFAVVQLRVSVPRPGTYDGSLLVLDGGALRGQLAIAVTKNTDAGLRLDGASGGSLSMESPVPEFQRAFRVLSTSGAPTPVQLRVSPLTDPLSMQVPTTVEFSGRRYVGEQLVVPAQGELAFTVAADLPVGGDYRGTVAVVYGTEPLLVDLIVRRTRVTPTVAVDPIGTVQARMLWGFRPTDVDVRVLLRETNGQRVVLDAPALIALTRDTRGGPVAADYDTVQVMVDGRRTETVTLEPNQTREITLRVTGLSHPGKYTGSVRLASGDTSALTSPISILLHQGILLAALAILLGVAISAVLRWYLTAYRPALTSQLRLSRLRDDLDIALKHLTPLDEQTEVPLKRTVQEQLDQLRRQYGQRERTGEADLTSAADKANRLPTWIRLRRAVDAAGNPTELVSLLSVVTAYLEADLVDPQRDALLTEADRALVELKSKAKPAATLSRALDALAADASGRSDVLAHVDAAKEAMRVGKMQDANARYSEARLGLARELTDEVNRTATGTAPIGVDPTDWNNLKRATAAAARTARAATVPESAETAYRDASRRLFGILIAGLRVATESLRKVTQQPSAGAAEDKRFGTLRMTIDQADKATTAGDMPAARRHYEHARSLYENLEKEAVTTGRMGPSKNPVATAPSVAAAHLAWRPAEEKGPTTEVRLSSATQIRIRQLVFDSLTNAVILVVAVGLGLFLLFVPDASWGGLEDWLTAILWGLGLHQVGDSVFGGFSGLRRQFATATQPNAAE
ncbi:hypothetical protein [Phytohabitans aurantiacus]|uniref:hypothetical protein n=1 Tax=Phytohabitans aurantiacus TaxID=3016789 RepID=UPI0024906B3E|nr:hypothetical protein [Phytohabitans aurantiacus]